MPEVVATDLSHHQTPRQLDATHQRTTVVADFAKRAAIPVSLRGTDSRMAGKPKSPQFFGLSQLPTTPPLANGGWGGDARL